MTSWHFCHFNETIKMKFMDNDIYFNRKFNSISVKCKMKNKKKKLWLFANRFSADTQPQVKISNTLLSTFILTFVLTHSSLVIHSFIYSFIHLMFFFFIYSFIHFVLICLRQFSQVVA